MKKNYITYETPQMVFIEVAVECGFYISGDAPDSDDSDFGIPTQRRETWGNLWE